MASCYLPLRPTLNDGILYITDCARYTYVNGGYDVSLVFDALCVGGNAVVFGGHCLKAFFLCPLSDLFA